MVLRLTAPAFLQGGSDDVAPTPEAPSVYELFLSWTVAEVAGWLEAEDAAGIADVLRKNGVRGADVLRFTTAAELQEALWMTPFAAQRLLDLRDTALANQTL